MMPPEEIKRLRELCEATKASEFFAYSTKADEAFDSASRAALPALLDEVEQYHKLLDACRVVRERVGKVAIHGWSMEQFLADGSLREIVVAMLPVDSKRGDA